MELHIQIPYIQRVLLDEFATGFDLVTHEDAEEVVGAAFSGKLPEGVRVTSKCGLGNTPRAEIEPLLRQSIEASLKRLRL